MKATLTDNEKAMLTRLEATVEVGVKASLAVLEAGKALGEIRSRQLHRDSAASWDEYVQARFKITKRRADQMIAFAGVSEAIKEVSKEMGTTVPIFGERAVRPLVGLATETVAEVIAEAAGTPAGITPATIRKAAARRKPKAAKVPRPRRFKVPGATVVVTWNRKGSGNVLEALAAAMRQLQAEATEAA